MYLSGVVFAFIAPWVSVALYTFCAFMWLVPDSRIEQLVKE
jgi:hypothetical protein